MARYALLVRESSNRVFGAAAPALACAELSSIARHLSQPVSAIRCVELGGLPYVGFEHGGLDDRDCFLLSNLALIRGGFELVDATLLAPLVRSPLEYFGSDLVTIQRYPGKTNEQFTHLLVNVTVEASRSAHDRSATGQQVRLLDPVAGRGSTLNRGLMYGFAVAGIEVEKSNVDQYKGFLGTYLKDHRLKHKITSERIRKGDLARSAAFDVRFGRGHGGGGRTDAGAQVRMVRASSEQAGSAFARNAFDVIVGDLPYGIQHRAKGNQVTSHSSVEELVENSVKSWASVLAPGGAIGLSWNVKNMPRDVLIDLMTCHGLSVVEHDWSFQHVVDRQITRDVLVCSLGGSSGVKASELSVDQSR